MLRISDVFFILGCFVMNILMVDDDGIGLIFDILILFCIFCNIVLVFIMIIDKYLVFNYRFKFIVI